MRDIESMFAALEREGIRCVGDEALDEAFAQAKQADDALARKQTTGVFHGLPTQVKECFAVAGRRSISPRVICVEPSNASGLIAKFRDTRSGRSAG